MKKYLKASTLMESLVAMVLIMLTMCIGGMIYGNVLSGSDSARKLKAQLLLEAESEYRTRNTEYRMSKVLEKEDRGEMKVVTSVEPYKNMPGLLLVTKRAVDTEGKVLAERKELVTTNEPIDQ